MYKKILISALFSLIGWGFQTTMASVVEDKNWQKILLYSSENLNFNLSTIPAEIIEYCNETEAEARLRGDDERLFLIQEIKVNFYCLQGDIALAIDQTEKMYEEAKRKQSKAGTALALQALGTSYIHTNRLNAAKEAFDMAANETESLNSDLIKVRLLLRKLHILIYLNQIPEAKSVSLQIDKTLANSNISHKSNYLLYADSYRLLIHSQKEEWQQADALLEKILRTVADKKIFDRYMHMIYSYYYAAKQEFDKSLSHSDSALTHVGSDGNINEYINLLTNKAKILEFMGNYRESYQAYSRINQLVDSLDMDRYLDQINTLRTNYWVDALQIETAKKHNNLLTWITVSSLLLLAFIVAIGSILKHRNRLLEKSRTRLAEASEKASLAIEAKSIFLSTMSHELRTPLNGIVGFSQLLATSEITDEEMKKQCGDNIRQNSELLIKLINDVMDLSNLKENEMTFTFEPCEIVRLCQSVVDTINTVKQTSAELIFKQSVEQVELITDSERLQQVLINLLINATKFTPQGTITLQLDSDAAQSNLLFTVEDTGCGIPLEEQPHIFNRFEKLHESIQGFGLGLSISQLIVAQLGGKIWIDPEYTQGARFVFTLPLNKELTKEVE